MNEIKVKWINSFLDISFKKHYDIIKFYDMNANYLVYKWKNKAPLSSVIYCAALTSITTGLFQCYSPSDPHEQMRVWTHWMLPTRGDSRWVTEVLCSY